MPDLYHVEVKQTKINATIQSQNNNWKLMGINGSLRNLMHNQELQEQLSPTLPTPPIN